jgi:Zn-dependent membrane protease YugP
LEYLFNSGLKASFAYAKVPTSSGLSGKEVAEKMLRDNGIYKKAKDALKWAALTYVVAALASIAVLVQYRRE